MGSCNSSDRVVVIHNQKPNSTSSEIKKNAHDFHFEEEKPYVEPRFRDMPEWEGERFRGEGVKRMKGYKCELQIDLLNQLREDFWNSKVKEKMMWKHLRQACLMDDVRAALIIKQLGLEPVDNCINHLIDEKGMHFYIPNFCINDPYFEKVIKEDNGANLKEKIFKIFITDLYENLKTPLEVSSLLTVAELKKLYFSTVNLDISKYKCRMFFGGAEIQDDNKLFQYNIKDEFQIQIIKTILE